MVDLGKEAQFARVRIIFMHIRLNCPYIVELTHAEALEIHDLPCVYRGLCCHLLQLLLWIRLLVTGTKLLT